MTKRLQVLLNQEEYTEIRTVARGNRMTVAEWVRQALRRAREGQTANSVQESPSSYFAHGSLVYYTTGMTKRLQVLLDEDEFTEIHYFARGQRLTVAEWVRQTLRNARYDQTGTTDVKLRAIAEAYRHYYPTADIDTMLGEIEAGRR